MAYSWLNDPNGWTNGVTVPQKSDFVGIYTDLRTWGGNPDAAGYGLTNASFLILNPGGRPGAAFTVTAGSWSSGTATLTIGTHTVEVGQHIVIASVSPSGYNSADAVVTAVTSTTVSYAVTSNPGAWSSGGTVTIRGTATRGMLAVSAAFTLEIYNGSAWAGVTSSSYTPEGTTTAVTVTTGSFSYTNSSAYVEHLKIHGDGVLTSVTTDSTSWPLEFPMVIVLYPGQAMTIVSTVAPTMIRKRKAWF